MPPDAPESSGCSSVSNDCSATACNNSEPDKNAKESWSKKSGLISKFSPISDINGVTDIDAAAGHTIALGKIDSTGTITNSTTTDSLTRPINYFHFQSADTATAGGKGGGNNCSAGPVTLEAV